MSTLLNTKDDDMHTLKLINKKILVKNLNKSSKILEEDTKQEYFIMLKKGSVQLYREVKIHSPDRNIENNNNRNNGKFE